MKKTKFLTRVIAVVFAIAILFAMSVPAWAVTGDLAGDGIVGNFTDDNPSVFDGQVILYKEITAYNPESCTVNAPTITYNYEITSGSAGKNIYDIKTAHTPNQNAHVLTKAGVGTPTIQGSIDTGSTWVNDSLMFTPLVQLDASPNGTKNASKFQIKIDFSTINWNSDGSGAGVYRYKISETTNETAKNAAGIKEGSDINDRYIDVYVNGNNEIYGYVCFTNDNDIDARDTATLSSVADAGKTEGFVDANTSETVSSADEYYTFNFEVGKTVANDAHIQNTYSKFPFTVTLTNLSVTANVLPIMTFSDDGSTYNTTASHVEQTALTASPIAGTWNPSIGHQASVKYVGIPCGTTVNIYEQNNVPGVTYVSSSEGADSNATSKQIFYNGTTMDSSNIAVISCGSTAFSKATENHTKSMSKAVIFTNTLLTISPTGLAFRVAPYVLMLAAGVSLIVLFAKRKHEATDMI